MVKDHLDHFFCLVGPGKILRPPLHIKLGLMKQFVKVLSTQRRRVFQVSLPTVSWSFRCLAEWILCKGQS